MNSTMGIDLDLTLSNGSSILHPTPPAAATPTSAPSPQHQGAEAPHARAAPTSPDGERHEQLVHGVFDGDEEQHGKELAMVTGSNTEELTTATGSSTEELARGGAAQGGACDGDREQHGESSSRRRRVAARGATRFSRRLLCIFRVRRMSNRKYNRSWSIG
jgi:hypothetical protein